MLDIYIAMQYITSCRDYDYACFGIFTSGSVGRVFKSQENSSTMPNRREMAKISSLWVFRYSSFVDDRIWFGDGKSIP
jgi:hypothetical protein